MTAQNLGVCVAELGLVEVVAKALFGLGDVLVDFGFNLGDVLFDENVCAVALFAVFVVDERIVEGVDVTGGFPCRGVHEDGSINADDVLVHAHHCSPPILLDVVLQLTAQLAVIVGGAQAVVNLTAGKDKPVLLRVADDFFQSVVAHDFMYSWWL